MNHLKLCPTCRVVKSFDDFAPDGRCADGKRRTCRTCDEAEFRAANHLDELVKPPPPPKLEDFEGQEVPEEILESLQEFRCASCRRYKVRTEFSPLKNNRDGLHPYCKRCMAYKAKLRRNVKEGKLEKWQADELYAKYLKEQEWEELARYGDSNGSEQTV